MKFITFITVLLAAIFTTGCGGTMHMARRPFIPAPYVAPYDYPLYVRDPNVYQGYVVPPYYGAYSGNYGYRRNYFHGYAVPQSHFHGGSGGIYSTGHGYVVPRGHSGGRGSVHYAPRTERRKH